MRTLTSLRKTTLASFVIIICSGSCHHGSAQSPNHEAANRKTWSSGNPQQITIAVPAAPFKIGKGPGKYLVEARMKK